MDSYEFPAVTQLAIPFFVIAILLELWLVRTGRAKGESRPASGALAGQGVADPAQAAGRGLPMTRRQWAPGARTPENSRGKS